MEYNISPIETKYKGRMFRSRLEARWAAFFDLLDWHYDYEPMDLKGWSPDFLLMSADRKRELLVEVKPITTLNEETIVKIKKAAPKKEVILIGSTLEINTFKGWPVVGWIQEWPWPGWCDDSYGDGKGKIYPCKECGRYIKGFEPQRESCKTRIRGAWKPIIIARYGHDDGFGLMSTSYRCDYMDGDFDDRQYDDYCNTEHYCPQDVIVEDIKLKWQEAGNKVRFHYAKNIL